MFGIMDTDRGISVEHLGQYAWLMVFAYESSLLWKETNLSDGGIAGFPGMVVWSVSRYPFCEYFLPPTIVSFSHT